MKNIVALLRPLVYVGGAVVLILHGHPCFAILLLILTPTVETE